MLDGGGGHVQIVPVVACGGQGVGFPVGFDRIDGVLGFLRRELLPVFAGELVIDAGLGHVHGAAVGLRHLQGVLLPVGLHVLQGVLGRLLRKALPVGAGELVVEPGFGHVHQVHIHLGLREGVAILLGRGVLRGLGRRRWLRGRFGGGLGRCCWLRNGRDRRDLRLSRPLRGHHSGPRRGLGDGCLILFRSVVEDAGEDDQPGQDDLPGRLQSAGLPDRDDPHDGQKEYP